MSSPASIRYVPLAGYGKPPVVIMPILNRTTGPEETFRPHRHDFQEVIWIHSGAGTHTIDGREGELRGPCVSLIARGQVHAFREMRGLNGYAVSFTEDLLGGTPTGRTNRLLFNYSPGDRTFPVPPEVQLAAEGVLDLTEREYARAQETGDLTLLRPLMEALLVLVRRAVFAGLGVGENAEVGLVGRFLDLLEHDFARHHDVAHYAGRLNVSAKHLSRATNAGLGKSAKGLIQDRVILEARRLLSFTDLSVKEVTAEVGFADPFTFSRAFKGAVGASPQDFRDVWKK
ncbi:helix-turn-helix domain-containing protein [Deinococcus planocerae]|uniref:helix-turn-helix domain-containing protein n=1 Tax=Deinococcus planocerae TaxID=1737569 RepID=UPI000C7F3D6F|nr:AraC family transcriptional regulator [Deinococcus planocerae]